MKEEIEEKYKELFDGIEKAKAKSNNPWL
uniref:Uncharacterized protein n=1 Tax=Mimivirus LCMiAC02 TaxID=2506609 RepID=A0A4D5XF08_9VIRU|nr:MAG: hypothetical protein LCMiAC02_03380 [Mimivirus LCMiAC02]